MTKLATRLAITLALFGILAGSTAHASTIVYSDFVEYISVQINSTTYSCTSTSDPNCAFVTITATGNTSTVQPFSVTNASGFKNTVLGPATVTIDFNGGGSITEVLVPGQIYVSVDQTNGGAGFGSSYSPTYPAATYGGSADYAHYNLQSNFLAGGFSGFCPNLATCNTFNPLNTESGDQLTLYYPFRPNGSYFSSTVSAPEPATASLVLLAAGVGLRAVRRRHAGLTNTR